MLVIIYLFLDYILEVLTIFITCSCTVCTGIVIQEVLSRMILKMDANQIKQLRTVGPKWCEFNWFEALSFSLAAMISFGWYFTKNWILNNILGLSMSFVFLKTIRLNKLLPGVVLLCLLFFYDIFWVFYSTKFTTGGQSVMVAVATKFDVPAKLLMPHITNDYPTANCSMLGLGDIVVPGIYIGFLIKFGKLLTRPKTRVYRNASLIAYAAALLCCGACLILFNQAQPALLYIVPALLLATLAVGAYRGEIHLLRKGFNLEQEFHGQAHIKRIESELAESDSKYSTIRARDEQDPEAKYEV